MSMRGFDLSHAVCGTLNGSAATGGADAFGGGGNCMSSKLNSSVPDDLRAAGEAGGTGGAGGGAGAAFGTGGLGTGGPTGAGGGAPKGFTPGTAGGADLLPPNSIVPEARACIP